MSGSFALTLTGAAGAITLRFAPLSPVPIELTPIYRGMSGPPGPAGPPGPVTDVDDMPSLSLLFENQLI